MEQAQHACYRIGLNPVEFWDLTPYQSRLWLDARIERTNEKSRRQTTEIVWLAYHTAGFSRSKRMPNYGQLMAKMGLKERKIQTPDEILRFVETMNAALGGRDLRKKDMN